MHDPHTTSNSATFEVKNCCQLCRTRIRENIPEKNKMNGGTEGGHLQAAAPSAPLP